jgi:hypothetical protein
MQTTPTLVTESVTPQPAAPQPATAKSAMLQSAIPQSAAPKPAVIPQPRRAVQATPPPRQVAAQQEAAAPAATGKSPEQDRPDSPDQGPLARYQRRVDLLLAEKAASDEAGGASRPAEQGTPATRSVAAPVWLKPVPAVSLRPIPAAGADGPVPSAASHAVSRYAADWAARLVRLAGNASS